MSKTHIQGRNGWVRKNPPEIAAKELPEKEVPQKDP